MAKKTKKFKKQYFLFGEQICRVLAQDGIKEAIEAAKSGVGYAIYVWDENSTPNDLLGEAQGWEDSMSLTTAEYNKLSKV